MFNAIVAFPIIPKTRMHMIHLRWEILSGLRMRIPLMETSPIGKLYRVCMDVPWERVFGERSSVVKESACNAWDTGDAGSVPGSGRSPEGGNGNPLQYSYLENPMD